MITRTTVALIDFNNASAVQEATIILAAIVILTGTRLCWTAPRHRMSMEERAKDGVITEEQARRSIQRRNWCGPATIVVGVVLLAYGVLR
jgi:hypothetical protein